jgi:hypothetical protein
MRPIVMASVVLAMAAGDVLVQETLAQNAPMTGQSLQTPPLPPLQSPSTSGAAGIPQAPVGHRQPTPRDLPPEIRREEQSPVQSPAPAQRGIDQDLRICSGC